MSGTLATDLKPYTTLSYANGPGYTTNFNGGVRPDLTNVDTSKNVESSNLLKTHSTCTDIVYIHSTAADSFRQPATVPLGSETHGGDDVGIFAYGPQAHLFQGVYEQNYIAHVMAYAACIGPGLKFCN